MKINLVMDRVIKNSSINLILEEYKKRLSTYVKIDCVTMSLYEVLDKLGIMDRLFIVVEGKNTISSVEFSEVISRLEMSRVKQVYIFIGKGKLDLDKERYEKLVISNMSFSNEMYLCILYEQIYRGYKIIHNESYHK